MRKFAVVGVVLLGLGYALLAWTLDVNGDTLGRSLAGEANAPYYQFGCRALTTADTWSCLLFDGSSGVVEYRVQRTDGKCWKARRLGGAAEAFGFPRAVEGCVDVFEVVRGSLGFGPDQYD